MDLLGLQHSAFLQSLGWAIANSLWQAAVLWTAYLLVTGVYRNASAKFKNTLSTVLIFSVFTWFWITFFARYFSIEDSATYIVQYYEADRNAAISYKWTEIFDQMVAILPYLSSAYLLLLLFLSLRLINVYRFTSFIKSTGLQKPGAEWKLFTEKVARHMGITRKIRLWVSHHIDVPATIGFIKPVILIPVASVNQLSADQLEAIILHELSHIKRNDYLINLFVSIIETILFFNPFVVLMARVIKRERENCCDDFVIQYQYDRHAYASALLSLEQYRNIHLKLAIGATSGKKQLFQRIKRIMEINNNVNFNYGQKLAALLLITCVICSVAWLSPEKKENKKLVSGKDNELMAEKKIINTEKPGSIFLNVAVNKIKDIALKTQPKRPAARSEMKLKDLEELSQKEIAQNELIRTNRLLLESKKQVSRRKIEKININKLFTGNGSTYATLFEKAALVPFRTATANDEAYRQRVFIAADFQKLQSELEKTKFTFTFDCYNMEEALRSTFMPKQQLKTALLPQEKKPVTSQNQVEKLHRPDLQQVTVAGSGSLTPSNHVVTTPGFYDRTVLYFDSLVTAEKRIYRTRPDANGHSKTVLLPAELKLVNTHGGNAYTYVVNNKENKLKKTAEITAEKSLVRKRQTPSTPVVSPHRYHLSRIKENSAERHTELRTTIESDKIKVEYKNGIVYFNGKEILAADKNEIIAQILHKGKKITTKIKEGTIEVND